MGTATQRNLQNGRHRTQYRSSVHGLGRRQKLLTDKTTIHGYAIDEIKSALQKAIRLGDEHLALQCAVELDLSKKSQWVWDRLHVLASEDVGLARLGLHKEIEDLHTQWKKRYRENPTEAGLRGNNPERLFLINAVLILARNQKSRLVDHALITYYENQQPIEIPEDCKQSAARMYDNPEPIEIPDAALDKHTKRGRNELKQKGAAGINHFFDVGATLKSESPAIVDPYKELARLALLQKNAATRSKPALASSHTAQANYTRTCYAVRHHRQSGYFVTGSGRFPPAPGYLSNVMVDEAFLFDDPQQMDRIVTKILKLLGRTLTPQEEPWRREDFELLKVQVAYTVTPFSVEPPPASAPGDPSTAPADPASA